MRALVLRPRRPLALSPRRPLALSRGRPLALIPIARLLCPHRLLACRHRPRFAPRHPLVFQLPLVLPHVGRLSCLASSPSAAMKVSPRAKKARISTTVCAGAKFATTKTLATRVSSYHKHFGEYTRTTTRAVHRVPGKVWKQVYAVYKATQACPHADVECDEQNIPAEKALQVALRAALEQYTRVSYPSGAAKVVPQSEEILRR
jgi:hypothetical protein